MTTTDSGVADAMISTMVHQVAEAAAKAVLEEGVGALPLPTHTSFALGSKQDLVLNVVSGDVNITSTTAQDKHVTLTPNHWSQLMSIRQQIDVEAKETNRQTHLMAFRAHIGYGYYVSVTSGYGCVDIRRFYIPYGLPCEHMHPTRSGLGLRLDESAHLLKLILTIHERHPELAIAEPSSEETEKRL